jgi:acyl-coenzyme A thioesterase 13
MQSVTPNENHAPPGFEVFESSPLVSVMGPVWIRRHEVPPTFGIRIEERHGNTAGTAHGAVLVTLADVALGHGIRAVANRDLRLVTTGLTVDFARPIRVGEWVEAKADIQYQSRRNVFASCFLVSANQRAVRVSGIYSVIDD